jgi:ABC-type Fe3+/spermidine/putrescine transport system ATPase subunit
VVEVFGHRLSVPQPLSPVSAGQEVHIVVRPEAVEIVTNGGLKGTVRRAAYLGSVIDYDVEVGGEIIGVVVYDPRRKELHREGEEVGLSIIGEAAYLLPK